MVSVVPTILIQTLDPAELKVSICIFCETIMVLEAVPVAVPESTVNRAEGLEEPIPTLPFALITKSLAPEEEATLNKSSVGAVEVPWT